MKEKRIIKFRAWDESTREMFHNVQNGIYFDDGSCYDFRRFISEDNQDPFDTHSWVLMQWTGLLDKNGKEIYEGDIVKAHDHPEGIWDVTDVVTYSHGEWCLNSSIIRLAQYGTAWLEVIGDIYTTPNYLNH